jgi:hypothetical protein
MTFAVTYAQNACRGDMDAARGQPIISPSDNNGYVYGADTLIPFVSMT